MIIWTEIDIDNLPSGEVLAINKRNDSIVGTLYRVEDDVYAGDDFDMVLPCVTHFSEINKPLK